MKGILDQVFDWLPFGIGVSILIGVGLAMLADEFKSFNAARVCFYVSALYAYGKILMWALFTAERFFVRATLTFLVFGVVGVGLIEALRLTTLREATTTKAEHPEPPPSLASPPPNPNAESHGTTDSLGVKAQHHGATDSAVAEKHSATKPTQRPKAEEKPPTLETLFTQDLPYVMKATFSDTELRTGDGPVLPIKRASGGTPGQMTSARDLTFSGRVLLYEGNDLSIEQQADIIKIYKAAGFDVQIRGTEWLINALTTWHREHDAQKP